MNFQENLWNNYEMVYNHFSQRRKALKNFITMINEMQKCDDEYSKSIKKIYDYGYELAAEGTLGESLRITKEHFLNKSEYHSELAHQFKNAIVEPAKAFLDKQNTIGKNIYNEIKKAEKEYTDALSKLDKAQARFHKSAQEAETAKIEAEMAKENYITLNEREKRLSASLSRLTEAKENEMTYISALSKANALRKIYIEVSKRNLQGYEQLEKEYIEYTKEMIREFFTYSNCCLKNVACDIEKGYHKVDFIDCVKDIQAFIEPNQTNAKPPGEIEYEPYSVMLQANPEDYQIPPKMAYNVIVDIQSTFTKTAEYYDPINEFKKIQINEISQQVCEQGETTLAPQDKRALLQLLKEKQYRLTFLYYLNRIRSDGKFTLSFNCYKMIGDILNYILDEASIEKDYESAKYCIILSQTFHYIGDNKEKICLQGRIENHEMLKSAQFWENYIAYSLYREIEKMEVHHQKITETDEERNHRISNVVFSQLLPITENMLEFSVEKEKIKEIINAFSKQYPIDESLVWQINKIIDDWENTSKDNTPHTNAQSSSSMINEVNSTQVSEGKYNEVVSNNEGKTVVESCMSVPGKILNCEESSVEISSSDTESKKDKSGEINP